MFNISFVYLNKHKMQFLLGRGDSCSVSVFKKGNRRVMEESVKF